MNLLQYYFWTCKLSVRAPNNNNNNNNDNNNNDNNNNNNNDNNNKLYLKCKIMDQMD